MSNKIEDWYFRIYSKIESNRLLSSIRQGCILVMPIFLIGSFSLVLSNFPNETIRLFIETVADGKILIFLNFIYDTTFGMAGLYLLMSVSYKYSVALTRSVTTLNFVSVIVSVMSYIALLGTKPSMNYRGVDTQVLLMNYMNVSNIFSSLFVAICSTYLFIELYKRASTKIIHDYADIDIRNTVSAIKPVIATISFFCLIALIMSAFTPYDGFSDLVIHMIAVPFLNLGRSVISVIVILLCEGSLWFFGVHGSNTFEMVNSTIFSNVAGEVITRNHINIFVFMGGSGSALSLLLALHFFSKNRATKSLVKRATIPMIFNINEILIFGLPIVFNPIFIVPFVLTPIICFLTTTLAMNLHWVPTATTAVSWTEPIILSAYHATGSWSAVFLQLFNLGLGILIYLPFVKINDKIQLRHKKRMTEELTKAFRASEEDGNNFDFTNLPGNLYKASKDISANLVSDITNENIVSFYQPQVSNDGKVLGAESLLRYKGDLETVMYPPLVIALAKEHKVFNGLTKLIIENTMRDIKILTAKGRLVTISVNVDAKQVTDMDFVKWIIQKSLEYDIPAHSFCLELTEKEILLEKDTLCDIFELLQENNITLAIDDFTMGATSLTYLQLNPFDFVKLDGSIVKNISLNKRSYEIADSIISLGKSLDFYVVAEYVETIEQKELLESMGCYFYQGYLYSPAIPFDDFKKYLKER